MPLDVQAHCAPIQLTHTAHRCHRGIGIAWRHQEPAYAVLDQLRHRSARVRDRRGARGHGFDHGETKRLIELDEMEQRRRAAQEHVTLGWTN